MGCSSSALHKAGDASRFRSVTSNEHFSTKEENESCFAQPKPCKMGSGPSFYDNVLRDSLPPLEKLKIPKASMANGVNLLCEQPLASWGKDVADQPGKTQLLEGPEGSESPQPGGRDDIPGREEKNKDAEAVTEIQYLKGNAETKSLTTEASDQPLRTAGERDPAGTVKGPENPRTAREMKPLETSEEKQLLETAGELQAQKTGGNDEQLHLPETVPKGSESPEILEESQFVDTAEEQQLQETGGGDEQPQLLETIPKENEMPEMLGRNQLVETAVKNDSLHKMPKGPGNMEQIQPEGIVESMKQQATEANVEMVRNIHTSEEDQQVEGETGEKVESEVVNEKVSEKAEKKEETGEAVGPSAAT